MRISLFLAGTMLLAVSACSSGDDKAATPDGPVKRESGSWKNNIVLQEFNVPGAPPELQSMMQNMMTAASKEEICLTPEQAAKEDIAAELAKTQSAQQCEFTKRDVGGGAINVEATCKGDGGAPLKMTMTGKSGKTKTEVQMTMTGQGPTGGEMVMTLSMGSERTGPCKKGQKTTDGSVFS
jgi:hypothetical protein